MTEIVAVRFKSGGKQYYFDPKGLALQEGSHVIVETSRGLEYGECVQGNTQVEDSAVTAPLRPVVRAATAEDDQVVARNREKEKRAFAVCQEKIAQHGLEMKLVEAEYSFEGNKVLFFFTAEGRVDFRALVKDLASTIHARIELRQIGVRDEAKMLGGLGICGRPFCCAGFLDEFQPVSIKMAKTQNLSLNPTKISGTCGRLMCCLKYEQEAYEDLLRHTPKAESFVETPDGAGTVCGINLLRQKVQVRLESAPDTPKTYHNCELCVIRNGKGKRPEDYVQPPLEELAKLRKVEEPKVPEESLTGGSSLAAALEAVFNGEVPQYEGFDAPAAPGEEGKSRSRRRRSRGGRGRSEGEEKRPEGAQQPRAPKESREGKGQRPPQSQKGERPAQPQKGERPAQPPKGERQGQGGKGEQQRPAQAKKPRPAPAAPQGQQQGAGGEGGGEKRSRPRRRRRPRGQGGGQGGSPENS